MSCRYFYPDCCWVAKNHTHSCCCPIACECRPPIVAICFATCNYLRHILPDPITKLSLLEVILGSRVPEYSHLQCLCVCSSPTFILDPWLQDGSMFTKWLSCSCLGCFMGYSPFHSSTVSIILNL